MIYIWSVRLPFSLHWNLMTQPQKTWVGDCLQAG